MFLVVVDFGSLRIIVEIVSPVIELEPGGSS
jgi:hypothetical protein